MTVETKTRVGWIDTAKAIGIVLMITGHFIDMFAGTEGKNTLLLIMSFHMPLFFFISGLTLRPMKNESMQSFMVKKAKEFLLPALILEVFYFATDILRIALTKNERLIQTISMDFECIITQSAPLVGSLWFLSGLYLAEIVVTFIIRMSKDNIVIELFYLPLSLIVYEVFVSFDLGWNMPFSANASCFGSFFLMIGYISNRKGMFVETIDKLSHRQSLRIGAFILMIWFVFALTYNRTLWMTHQSIYEVVPISIIAILGILGVMFISKVCSCYITEYLGKITIPILFVQQKYVLVTLVVIENIISLRTSIPYDFAMCWYFTITISSSLLIGYVLDSLSKLSTLDFVFGKRKTFLSDNWKMAECT